MGKLTLDRITSDGGNVSHMGLFNKEGVSMLTVVDHCDSHWAAVYDDEDAHRLVACWNAFEGREPGDRIDTERIEKLAEMRGVRGLVLHGFELRQDREELINHLRELVATCRETGNNWMCVVAAEVLLKKMGAL